MICAVGKNLLEHKNSPYRNNPVQGVCYSIGIGSIQPFPFEMLRFKACSEQMVKIIAFIYDGVADRIEYQRKQDIQNGMLLEEHG